ncbi:MAG: PAS domain S-box protein [Chloroflexi bacterium]|nr:PAS domain S-box protein [Chloroflexota bacterium]
MDEPSINHEFPFSLLNDETAWKLIEALGQGVTLADEDDRFIYVNPAFARMIGRSPADILGKVPADIIHPDDLPILLEARQRRRVEQTSTYDIRLMCADNSIVYVHVTSVLKWHDGKKFGSLTVVTDITERKQAEQLVRQSEMQYQTLLATAQRQAQEMTLLDKVRTTLAQELDLDAVIRTVVEAIAATFGYTLVSLYLLQDDRLILQHQVGYSGIITEIPITKGVMGRVARSGKPVLLKDADSDPDFLDAIKGIVSEVCVPLIDQDEVVGTLNVESSHNQILGEADLSLMMALSKHINIAIHRARLYADMQRSQAQLQAVITNAPIVLWAVDKEGEFTLSTGKGLEGLGLKPGELVGYSVFDAFGSLLPELTRIFERALTGEEVEKTLEIAGTIFTTRHVPFLNEAGEVAGVTGVALDVTDQVRAEESLRASEERYRLLVNSVSDVIFQTNIDSEWTYLNKVWTDITGFSLAESLNEKLLTFVHPDDRDKNTAAFLSLIEKRKDFCYCEIRFLTKEGGYRWLEIHARRIEEANGRILGASGLLRDMTERKQYESEVESFAAVSRALRQVNTSDQIIPIILDEAVNLLQARGAMFVAHSVENNKKIEVAEGKWQVLASQLLPLSEDVVAFTAVNDNIYLNDDIRSSWPPMQAARLHPCYAVIAVPVISKEVVKGVIWVGRQQPFSDIEGRTLKTIAEITAVALERTQIRETLEQQVTERTQALVAANVQLRELDQLKVKFINDVSHELRTPATAITLYLDLLTRGADNKRDAYLEALRANSQRLNEIIESILQFSDLTKAAAAHKPSALQLNEITADVVNQYRVLAKEADLRLMFSPNPELPSVLGIPRLLFQAIGYLVDNAIKYTFTGSVTVSTHHHENKPMIGVQIKDTGIGIESDELEKVFKRFYRGRQVSQLTIPGAGLGLPLAQQIAIQHKGQIKIESKPSRGTAVWLWLPMY